MSSDPLIPRAGAGPWFKPQTIWRVGALMVTVGMAAGAFGSHGLKKRAGITAEQLSNWGIASQYTIYNGLGLLLVSLHPRFSSHRWAPALITSGALIFSGSIFALVLDRDRRFRFLGPITPLGGMLMISGYVALAL